MQIWQYIYYIKSYIYIEYSIFVIELEEIFFETPNGAQVPKEIFNNKRFYSYFKINAILLNCKLS